MSDSDIMEYKEPERIAVTKKNYKKLLSGEDYYFYYMRYPYGDDSPGYEEIVNLALDAEGKLVYLYKGLYSHGIWTQVKTRRFWDPTFYIVENGKKYDLFASKKTVCGQCGSSPGAVCGYCRY
uniref:Uncharacterized protein n=1 Tax=viral metagenome TaxID=1070528 RepID=A0A6C0JTA5_9ZZZZ